MFYTDTRLAKQCTHTIHVHDPWAYMYVFRRQAEKQRALVSYSTRSTTDVARDVADEQSRTITYSEIYRRSEKIKIKLQITHSRYEKRCHNSELIRTGSGSKKLPRLLRDGDDKSSFDRVSNSNSKSEMSSETVRDRPRSFPKPELALA